MRKVEHFLIEVIEWASQKPQGFTYHELVKNFPNFEGWQIDIVRNYIKNTGDQFMSGHASGTNTLFHVIASGGGYQYFEEQWRYILNVESLFNYFDYQELKLAQESSKEARKVANYSIWIAILAMITTIIVGMIQIYLTWEQLHMSDKQLRSEYISEKSRRSVTQQADRVMDKNTGTIFNIWQGTATPSLGSVIPD